MFFLFLFVLLIISLVGFCFWFKFKGKVGKMITIFALIGSIALLTCRLTPMFKDVINCIGYDQQHRCTFNDMDTVYLPLPPKTSFEFRTSDVTAVYRCKLSVNEIKDYYFLFDGYRLMEQENVLNVKYGEVTFEISIRDDGRMCWLTIEGNKNTVKTGLRQRNWGCA